MSGRRTQRKGCLLSLRPVAISSSWALETWIKLPKERYITESVGFESRHAEHSYSAQMLVPTLVSSEFSQFKYPDGSSGQICKTRGCKYIEPGAVRMMITTAPFVWGNDQPNEKEESNTEVNPSLFLLVFHWRKYSSILMLKNQKNSLYIRFLVF